MLEEERDPADYLDELFRDFGGKGVMTDEGLARAKPAAKSPAIPSTGSAARPVLDTTFFIDLEDEL